MTKVSRIFNWTLAPGQTWWLADSAYSDTGALAHVAVAGRTLCGKSLVLSLRVLNDNHMVCGNCARVMEASESRGGAR